MTCPEVRFSANPRCCLLALSSPTHASISFIIKGFILRTSAVSDTACLIACRVGQQKEGRHGCTIIYLYYTLSFCYKNCLEQLNRWRTSRQAVTVLWKVHTYIGFPYSVLGSGVFSGRKWYLSLLKNGGWWGDSWVAEVVRPGLFRIALRITLVEEGQSGSSHPKHSPHVAREVKLERLRVGWCTL